ncbi:N-acetyltransferase [Pseudopedobacter sp.]|uniref:GNAT family N-acetyltransferase n=1 Tax=Pseudopedobacter sp. TaxID=1936787 RepID=UPI003340DE35
MIEIRKEQPADYPAIYHVNQSAFGRNAEARLVNSLRKNNNVFIPDLSLVAVDGENVVGHILFTKIKIDDGGVEHDSLSLAPMAVLPVYQKQGIGTRLIKKGLSEAKNLGYHSVVVLGHEGYYPKHGFDKASNYNINAPFEVPEAAFMCIALIEDGLKGINGTVRYPKEFDAV